MKFSENSLVVDVIKISNSSYKLSVPAGDLLTAAMNGAVLRRHDLSTAAVPNVLYVPLSEAKLSSGTYTFTFASGDAFTASSADAYPAASSVSDKTDSELPPVTSADETKVLTVDSNGDWVAADAPSGLPSTTSASAGDVLSLNNSKEAVWTTPSSGGGVLAVTESSKTLSASFNEILAALHDGKTVQIRADTGMDIVTRGIIYSVDEYANEYGVEYFDAFGFVSSGSANPNFYMWETQNPSTSSLTRS